MVALGMLLSTFWIISANSWMQTPAGYELRDGVFYPKDWWMIVFNHSFPYHLIHMILAAYLTTCFVIGGVAAWYLRRQRAILQGRNQSGALWAVNRLQQPFQGACRSELARE